MQRGAKASNAKLVTYIHDSLTAFADEEGVRMFFSDSTEMTYNHNEGIEERKYRIWQEGEVFSIQIMNLLKTIGANEPTYDLTVNFEREKERDELKTALDGFNYSQVQAEDPDDD